MDVKLVTNEFAIYDITDSKAKLVYRENPDAFMQDHMIYNSETDFWMFDPSKTLVTDIFDGIQLTMNMPDDSVALDLEKSGWITGSSPIRIESGPETAYFPWAYDIIFTDASESYTTQTTMPSGIKATDGSSVDRDSLLLEETYNFYVINKYSIDSTGAYEKLDLVTFDLDASGAFEWDQDIVLAGHYVESRSRNFWAGTIFSIDFRDIPDAAELPQINDVYQVNLTRPLTEADQFVFTINPEDINNAADIKTTMDSIKVVPNPYIATNAMETAVANKFLNQRRQIMFTHIPAECDIRIFTSSGVLVNHIEVDNEPSAGVVHWDVLSREGLEIAAGMYIYHVESRATGNEKVGKFAVIK
jgi:hypothetical protein